MRQALGWIVWALVTSSPSVASAEDANLQLWAVVPQVGDDVRVEIGDNPPRKLVEWDRIPAASKIRIPKNQSVGLMCSTDHWVTIQGEAMWTLNTTACASGEKVYPGIYQEIVSKRGRAPGPDGTLALDRRTRGGDDLVVLLSPRRTAVAEAQPTIRWLGSATASEYEIQISDHVQGPILIAASDAECTVDPAWDGDLVCSLPWPEDHRGLEVDKTYGLRVGFRASITSPLEADKDRQELTRLAEDEVSQLGEDLTQIDRFGFAEVIRLTLRAGLYAKHWLFADAIAAYQQIPDRERTDPLQVALADLYFEIGLVDRAHKTYQAAYDGSEGIVRATAAFGLGRCHNHQQEYDKAHAHFLEARNKFRELGLDEDTAAAEAAIEAVAKGR